MASSPRRKSRIVNDNIHGDIALTPDEWGVVNTATFQRLRSLKQLGMGHLVYPNATHTRFAHSLGAQTLEGSPGSQPPCRWSKIHWPGAPTFAKAKLSGSGINHA